MTVEPCVAINLAKLTMNFDRRYALKNFITDCTSQSVRAGIRASIFNCSNEATMKTEHASSLLIKYTQSLHAMNGLIAVGQVGKLLCGRPSYYASKLTVHAENMLRNVLAILILPLPTLPGPALDVVLRILEGRAVKYYAYQVI